MKKTISLTISFILIFAAVVFILWSIKGTDNVDSDNFSPVVLTAVAGGWGHSIGIKADRTVAAWGSNEHGQLGDGTTAARSGPVSISAVTDITAVAAGADHSIALKAEGSVWAWGSNEYGQLGDGTTSDRSSPVQVAGLSNVIAIAGGGGHTIALKKDGTVWTWGGNEYGQLGDGTIMYRSIPVQTKGFYGVVAVAAGRDHTIALKGDGTVWAWGANDFGQLGEGTTESRITPVEVKGISDIAAIACGHEHAVAIKKDGTVWAWGNNSYGQLGDGTEIHRRTPVQAQGIADASSISAGREHTIAVKKDGTVMAWGANQQKQLGEDAVSYRSSPVEVGRISGKAAVIASGGYHILALKKDGTAWAWGWNKYGQLGDGATSDSSEPVMAAVRKGVTAAQEKVKDRTASAVNATVSWVAGGGNHALALMSDGTVWAWGSNFNGQLGDGTRRDMKPYPVRVEGLSGVSAIAAGNRHSMALKKDGTVWTWGSNEFSQLGDGTAIMNRTSPVQAAGLNGVKAIACGRFFSLALKNDGTVWAWGRNEAKLWGDLQAKDRNVPAQAAGLKDVIAISARADHLLALMKDGTVTAIGSNLMGQIGNGVSSSIFGNARVRGLSDIVAVAAGHNHSVALKKDGTVWAWGEIGKVKSKDPKLYVSEIVKPMPVQISEISDAVAICAGSKHSMALRKDGGLWAWGADGQSQLGIAVMPAGMPSDIRGLRRADRLSDLSAVFCGDHFNVAIKKDKTVWSWGYNEFGELGAGTAGRPDFGKKPYDMKELGKIAAVRVKDFVQTKKEDVRSGVTPTIAVTSVGAGGAHSLATKSDGTLWAWGMNEYRQLGDTRLLDGYAGNSKPGLVLSLKDVTAVTGGAYNTLALKADGTVFELGRTLDHTLYDMKISSMSDMDMYMEYGKKLTMDSRAAPPKIKNPTPVGDLTDVVSADNGTGFSIALKKDGTVWAWGVNTSGQLGDGTMSNRNAPVQVKGLEDIAAVAAGSLYSLALGRDGTVWAWGAIMYPKSPLKKTSEEYEKERLKTIQTTPIKVSDLSDASAVAAGAFPLALKNDGTVWTCWEWKRNESEILIPFQVAGLDSVTAIASKGMHSVALKLNGTVWSWGNNRYGQLGDGTKADSDRPVQVEEISDITVIAAGAAHTIALKKDGTVWTWGNNEQGQLGDGTSADSAFPLQVMGL